MDFRRLAVVARSDTCFQSVKCDNHTLGLALARRRKLRILRPSLNVCLLFSLLCNCDNLLAPNG
jgi:hypothetical protein